MKDSSTALVFACGYSINEHVEYIPHLMEKYTCIGINRFPSKFAELYLKGTKSAPVDYWMFGDEAAGKEIIVPFYNNQKIVSSSDIPNTIKLLKNKNIPIYIKFHQLPELNKDNINMVHHDFFFGNGSTTLQSLSLLIKLGFKNVVIFGMDNYLDKNGSWSHFYPSGVVNKSENSRDSINDQLQTYKQFINIHKASITSQINVDVIDVKSLL